MVQNVIVRVILLCNNATNLMCFPGISVIPIKWGEWLRVRITRMIYGACISI